MSWPVELDHVVVGAQFKRVWRTYRGKVRFQVREVVEVGKHLVSFKPQMNKDCCRYVVVGGYMTGREGHCQRLTLSLWADGVKLPSGEIVKSRSLEWSE